MAVNPKHWAGAWNGIPYRQPATKAALQTQIQEAIDGFDEEGKKGYYMDLLDAIEDSDPIVPNFPAGRAIARGGKRRRTHGRKSHRKNRKSHRRNRKSHRRNRK